LATRFGYTPQEISEMIPYQQHIVLRGGDDPRVLTFQDERSYNAWLATRETK